MSDLIERLRAYPGECDCTLGSKAADEIERLTAVQDAAAWYVNSLENGKTAEAMNLRLQRLREALAAEAEMMSELVITTCKHGVNLTERDCRMCWHGDTEADLMGQIERLTARNEHLEKRFGYLEGDWERRNHIIESQAKRIETLEAALEWEAEVAGGQCRDERGAFCFEVDPESPDLWCTYCRITAALKGGDDGDI